MIQTRSSFFYISPVDLTNFYLDLDEGSGEISAMLDVGSFTHADLPDIVETALNNVGALTYSVTLDRDQRKYTISASGPFKIKKATGLHFGIDYWPQLGFTGADTGFATSHTSNIAAGVEYRPQFWLQNYVDYLDNQKAIDPAVVKTSNGDVEVVKFGTEKFFEMNIMLATNIDQGASGFIETSATGVEDLRAFLQFCVKKQNLEFIPNRDAKNTYFKVMLESTDSASDGTGYKLSEMYDKGLAGYYTSGVLKFRVRGL